MFLRGKSDIFLYEYLQEVCGDGLMPFMFQYEREYLFLHTKEPRDVMFNSSSPNPDYIEAKHQKLHRLREKANQSKHCYRIPPKLLLNVHSKPCHLKPPPTIHDFFPERNEKQFPQSGQAPSSRFNFRFAGCRPVALKSNKARHTTGGRSSSIFGMGVAQENNDHGRDGLGHQQSLKQNAGLLRGFQAKVVIARRKLLRPDTNQYRPRRVYCLGSTNL